MKSSFVNVFGKVTAAAAISLCINLTSQANAVPDLCGFDREYFLNQHAPKLKETYGTCFSFGGKDSSLPLISDDTLMQEAIYKGYSWAYGCPDLNLYEAARLNPWIKENFDKSFPALSSSSVDEMEVKSLYLRYAQDAILAAFYDPTPLTWVEGVAPGFNWEEADRASKEDKRPEESWIERAHNLQVQASNARLDGFKKGLATAGALNLELLNSRHVWVADMVLSGNPELKHGQILTQLLEVEAVIPDFLTEDPEHFTKVNADNELNQRVRTKAQKLITALDEKLIAYKMPSFAGTQKKKSSGKSRTPEQINFAVKHKINQLRDVLAITKNKVESAKNWDSLFESVSFINKNFKIQMDYLETYSNWLATNEVTVPKKASEFMDTSSATLTSQYLDMYQKDAEIAFGMLPGTFLNKDKLGTFLASKGPSEQDLNKQAREIALNLGLTTKTANITDDEARGKIKGTQKKLVFKITSRQGYSTEKMKTVLNKLQLEGKNPKKTQNFSKEHVFKDGLDQEQFRYFVAHRGQHTYLVYMQPTN